ncbi:MAG: relaxase/mobilization nuclease domain-containing protein [Butyricicoccus sp.]|nr:relaxase/mobilization nuclease domain-containing protein [Butyricicoccus sp.]
MAIISFTNYKRGQSSGCMRAVMRYTMQDKKTLWNGQQLVSGINCQPENVCADFMTTKRLYHKTGGVMFYHMVQSFPKGEAVDPVTAHAAALKLAEYYEGYEVLVCTHTDREHIHSHFLINSVNFDTGRKLHIAKEQLQELRQRNDQVCMEFSLPVFKSKDVRSKTKTMTIGEYHVAARGHSKKLQLMNIINDCMRHAHNQEEFISLMESEGYKVRWEESRKNITYTTPSGWQCRDRLLFGDKYLKENMENEFRLRYEIIYGRAHGEEPSHADATAANHRSTSYERRMGGDDGLPVYSKLPRRESDRLSEEGQRAADTAPEPDTDGRAADAGGSSGADGRTGWEPEREIFLSSKTQTTQTTAAASGWSDMGSSVNGAGGVASALVGFGRRMEQSQSDAALTDSTTTRHHADSKTMRKEREKKIALGQKEDDHEEEQIYQRTM